MELLAAGRWTPLITQALVYGIVMFIAMVVQLLKGQRDESPPAPPVRHVTGVRFHELKISDRARCPVCRMTIEPVVRVLCSACSTPHHKECWRYNARCATFACGERSPTV